MARIMVIWRSLVHQLDSIAVAEDQRKGVQFFSFFQRIMVEPLYIKL